VGIDLSRIDLSNSYTAAWFRLCEDRLYEAFGEWARTPWWRPIKSAHWRRMMDRWRRELTGTRDGK
jgi:hypothetical protein